MPFSQFICVCFCLSAFFSPPPPPLLTFTKTCYYDSLLLLSVYKKRPQKITNKKEYLLKNEDCVLKLKKAVFFAFILKSPFVFYLINSCWQVSRLNKAILYWLPCVLPLVFDTVLTVFLHSPVECIKCFNFSPCENITTSFPTDLKCLSQGLIRCFDKYFDAPICHSYFLQSNLFWFIVYSCLFVLVYSVT